MNYCYKLLVLKIKEQLSFKNNSISDAAHPKISAPMVNAAPFILCAIFRKSSRISLSDRTDSAFA